MGDLRQIPSPLIANEAIKLADQMGSLLNGNDNGTCFAAIATMTASFVKISGSELSPQGRRMLLAKINELTAILVSAIDKCDVFDSTRLN